MSRILQLRDVRCGRSGLKIDLKSVIYYKKRTIRIDEIMKPWQSLCWFDCCCVRVCVWVWVYVCGYGCTCAGMGMDVRVCTVNLNNIECDIGAKEENSLTGSFHQKEKKHEMQ